MCFNCLKVQYFPSYWFQTHILYHYSQGSFRASLPNDESELLAIIHTSLQTAIADGKVLLDVEVPVSFFDGKVA